MGAYSHSAIPVTVEFGSSLSASVEAVRGQGIEHRLASKLSALLQQLGLVGKPEIELQGVVSNRAIRVRVHGELQPYSPDLMKRVWRALAPTSLRDLPETARMAHQPGFPDAWFKAYLTGSNASDD